ncbi:MAG: TIGR04282 family arsenosugar biosynthesis glycosyltransferase [Proteobacteria bacterium]|nr:TIGR04282 family arsenosugar biosynthesis glycosyltransferase [Pseudomonadota bacterium]
MRARRHLVIVARAPRLGAGKRRLARDLGALAAWRFQRWMLGRVLHRLARDPRWTTWLAVTPDAAVRRAAWAAPARVIPQGAGGLGARMARLLRERPPGPVVIVGSDIPDLHARHVAQAFAALGRHDWVFGPAADGGYWLVGSRRRRAPWRPFDAVRWSSRHTLADSLANLEDARVALLEELHDVDTGEDLARFRKEKG